MMPKHRVACIVIIRMSGHTLVIVVWILTGPSQNIGRGFQLDKLRGAKLRR